MINRVLKSMSYSERKIAQVLAQKLPEGGSVVVGALAEEQGFSRSLAVGTLRKLGAAGVVESQNMGRRGTYIRVLDENVWDEMRAVV